MCLDKWIYQSTTLFLTRTINKSIKKAIYFITLNTSKLICLRIIMYRISIHLTMKWICTVSNFHLYEFISLFPLDVATIIYIHDIISLSQSCITWSVIGVCKCCGIVLQLKMHFVLLISNSISQILISIIPIKFFELI